MTPLMCLVVAVYFEARSEPLLGQYAVAEVIMNRVESSRFPDDVCAVVSQDLGPEEWDCQFSFMCDGKPEIMHDAEAEKTALAVASDVLNMRDAPDVTNGALFYHTVSVSPRWSRNMHVTAEYGSHKFFTDSVILADTTLD